MSMGKPELHAQDKCVEVLSLWRHVRMCLGDHLLKARYSSSIPWTAGFV